MAEQGAERRRIYGRRRGRPLRPGRRRLMDTLLPDLEIALPEPGSEPLDPAALFAHPVDDIWLEVGFGAGEHLAAQAAARPQIGFVGCEPFINGVAALLARIEAAGLNNIRIYRDDARALLDVLVPASLGRVFVLFPDPWPKRRHARRRFISGPTVEALARVLRPGGELRLATDDMGYCRWALAHLIASPAFEWQARCAADWRRPPADWVATRYEAKARAAARPCVYLRFRRRGNGDVLEKAC